MNDKPSPEALPFGLLELDLKGMVKGFSPVADLYSEVRAQDVVGRDFFKGILPADQCKEIEEQFHAFMERGDSVERLVFSFPSEQGEISVQIALAYLPEKEQTRLAIVRLMPEPGKSSN
jgi:hypothetical protein